MVRAAYFVSFVLIMGTKVTLLGPVLNAWVPQAPTGLLLASVFAGLALVNLWGTRAFALCEVVLSAIKVLALAGLIAMACYYAVFGTPTAQHEPVDIVAAILGTPFPYFWQAFILAALGYAGIESLAIVAAETNASAGALRRRMLVTSLAVVGLATAAVAASAAPVQSGMVSLVETPFSALLRVASMPWPQTLFRALILVTVLSVLNSLLYCASRMLFSLARAEQAPSALGRVTSRAVIATVALALGVILASAWLPSQTYAVATAIATTGLLFVWLAIFLTYVSLRLGRSTMPPNARKSDHLKAIAALGGASVVVAIAAPTLAIDQFASTLRIGLPFMFLLGLSFGIVKFIPSSKRSESGVPADAGRLSAPSLVE